MISLFDEPSKRPLPTEPELQDHAMALMKATVGAVPILGNAMAEELGLLLAPPLARRRDDWFSDLARRLHDLEGRVGGFRFDDLANNKQFVSATAQATQAALRTHDEAKLEALRNAVLNVAAGTAPEDHFQAFYLSLIDTLTPTHLRMLKQFKSQESVKIVESPEWLKSNVAAQIAKDLFDRGLLSTGPGLPAALNRDELLFGKDGVYRFHAVPSLLGNEFLSFITEPVNHG